MSSRIDVGDGSCPVAANLGFSPPPRPYDMHGMILPVGCSRLLTALSSSAERAYFLPKRQVTALGSAQKGKLSEHPGEIAIKFGNSIQIGIRNGVLNNKFVYLELAGGCLLLHAHRF